MAEKDPKNNDGLSPEELEQQEVSDLPKREAMSVLSPDATPMYYFGDPVLDQGLDPTFKPDPIKPPA
ncbi:MAG: hypothetical protein QOH93_603 [Chloroflexia bacterium]|jgi:hypothetical protein|nr:hypothetical protein [Chloroflexia bacterium]